MDGRIPRISGFGSATAVDRVHESRARDGGRNGGASAEAFEEQLEHHERDRRERALRARHAAIEREALDVGEREDDEAGGSLDLTA